MITRNTALVALAFAFATACGGSSETPAAPPEKNVTEQPTAAEPSTPDAPVSEAPGTADADPADVAPIETELSSEFASLPAPYNTADFARGKRVYKRCSSCHLTEQGAGHLVGPNLHGLFERKSGGLDDFTYSKALEEADYVWTPELVDEWLANPKSFLKGNRMSFAGLPKEQDRLAVIAYLMLETGTAPDVE